MRSYIFVLALFSFACHAMEKETEIKPEHRKSFKIIKLLQKLAHEIKTEFSEVASIEIPDKLKRPLTYSSTKSKKMSVALSIRSGSYTVWTALGGHRFMFLSSYTRPANLSIFYSFMRRLGISFQAAGPPERGYFWRLKESVPKINTQKQLKHIRLATQAADKLCDNWHLDRKDSNNVYEQIFQAAYGDLYKAPECRFEELTEKISEDDIKNCKGSNALIVSNHSGEMTAVYLLTEIDGIPVEFQFESDLIPDCFDAQKIWDHLRKEFD